MSDSTASRVDAGARLPRANLGAVGGEDRFVMLDGLRGVAAFAVILDHVPGGWLGDIVPGRYLSVDFFFVLSGFVLAHAYGKRLESGWSPWAFMQARLIRLYPMYLAGMAIGLGLALLGLVRGWEGPGWADVATVTAFSLLFLPTPSILLVNFGRGALYPFNGPAWSLFFELVANLVYALIARFLTWRVLGVILVIGAATVMFTAWRLDGVGGPGWLWGHFDAGLSRVMFDFFAGVAIYRLRERMTLPALPWWLAVIAFVAVIAVQVPAGWRAVYDIAAGLVIMPVLVALVCGTQVTGAVAKVCGVLGLLSYGVYVLHVPIFSALQIAAVVAHVPLPEGPALAILVAVLAGAGAWVGHYVYDQPLRKWLSGRVKRGKARKSPGEAG